MSAIVFEIHSEDYEFSIPHTTVYVDGKFAYQSGNHPEVEREHLQKLIDIACLDNIEVSIVLAKERRD